MRSPDPRIFGTVPNGDRRRVNREELHAALLPGSVRDAGRHWARDRGLLHRRGVRRASGRPRGQACWAVRFRAFIASHLRSRLASKPTHATLPVVEVDRDRGISRGLGAVLRVLVGEQRESTFALLAGLEHATAAAEAHPPQARPVLLVVVDQNGDVRIGADVVEALQPRRALRRSTAE